MMTVVYIIASLIFFFHYTDRADREFLPGRGMSVAAE